MAVVVNNAEDKEQQAQAAQTAPGQAPGMVAPGAQNASITPGATSGPSAAKTIGSGRFTNLQKYIQANAGSGEKIAGKIGQGVANAEQQVNKAVDGTSAVQNQIQAEKDRIAQASGFAQQVQQDPTQLTADANKLNAFTQLRTGQTNGQQIQGAAQNALGTAQAKLGELQNQAQLVGTEQGRFAMLQNQLGRPTYNKGQQRLDQLLVQAGGANTLRNLQNNAQTAAQRATGAIDNTTGILNTGLTDINAQAKAAQEQLMGALGRMDDPSTPQNEAAGAFGGIQNDLKTRAQQMKEQNDALQSQLQSGVDANGVFGPEALARLGLQHGQALYDVDLKNFVNWNYDPASITESGVATPEQLQRYQALAQLSGTDANYIRPDQVGKAGGLNIDADKLASLKETINNKHNDYQLAQSQFNDLKNRLSGTDMNGLSFLDSFKNAQNITDATKAYQQVFGQYGDTLGTNGSYTAPVNDLRQAVLDWYKKYGSINLNASKYIQDTSGGKGLMTPVNYLGTTKK